MTWYTASLIVAVVPDMPLHQGPIGVFEDFFLIEASSREAAFVEAESIGKSLEAVHDKLTVLDMPARRKYLGVRKLRSIYNNSGDIDRLPPTSGSELTHSYFEVNSLHLAKELAKGERVSVDYVDDNC